jgi:hypothetical protein
MKSRIDHPNDNFEKLIENEDEESFANFQSNFGSGQTFDFRQFINLSNAIGELSEKIKYFFENNKLHFHFLSETSFTESSSRNNRFCKFCFLKKVLNKINIYLLTII